VTDVTDTDTEPAHGRMTLMEHLGELRRRIIICAVAILVGAIVGFLVYNRIRTPRSRRIAHRAGPRAATSSSPSRSRPSWCG
jgi:Sec-independent protein secretion pathway component TatC